MIEYLEQLVEEKKFQGALKLGESLLRSAENPHELVRIHAATVVSHCMLGEQDAALADGEAAIGLAESLGEWDSLGTIALWVGIAYCRLGQLEKAVEHIYLYLSHLHHYRTASKLEADAWYNLGVVQATLGHTSEAPRAFEKSLSAAKNRGDERFAHGVRQALLKHHLKVGNLVQVPRLLAQCACYLRNHPDTESHARSLAYHTKFRGEYALATNRIDRANLIAARSLMLTQGNRLCEFLLHVLLAEIATRKENATEALGHALAARTCAVAIRRADLETEANDLIFKITQGFPVAFETVNQYFMNDL